MKRLLQLLGAIGSDAPPADKDLDEAFSEALQASEEELAELRLQLIDLLDAALDGDTPDIEAGTALRAAIDRIDKTVTERQVETDRIQAEAKKLLDGLRPAETGADAEEEEEGDGEDETTAAPAEAVAVGAALRASRAKVNAKAASEPYTSDIRIATIGAAKGVNLRQDANLDDVARVFADMATRVKSGRDSLVRIEKIYPEDRVLSANPSESDRLLSDMFSPQALAASGGVCAPLETDFTHPVIGERSRPLRDALPQFGASSGGIRYTPAVTLSDMVGGVGVWTNAMDQDPQGTKDCLTIECPSELSATIDAIVACLTIGNFQAKFAPQLWRSRLEAVMILHDRIAEQALLGTIQTAADALTFTSVAGDTIGSVLGAVERAAAGIQSRLRLTGTTTPILAVMDQWVRRAIRDQLRLQRLGSNTPADQFGITDRAIDAMFVARGVKPVWMPDADVLPAETPLGAMAGFPVETEITIFPQASWLYLDGGTLDLGTEVRDSTLNATNDRQAFVETFEGVAERGPETYVITVPISDLCLCPSVVNEGL